METLVLISVLVSYRFRLGVGRQQDETALPTVGRMRQPPHLARSFTQK